MDLNIWITVLLVGTIGVISPGPNWAVIIKNSLYSRSLGVSTVAGIATGSLIHIVYCLIGIGVIISKSILLFNTLKWIGVVYLLYIGIKLLRSKKQSPAAIIKNNESTTWKAFRSGFLTDMLNPKATLFYLAIFTQVIEPNTNIFVQSVYGLTVWSVEILWHMVLVFFLTHKSVRNYFLSISHWIERVTGTALILLGIRLAFLKND